MNENIYSATSNFDMKNSSIFTQLSENEEMFGGDNNTISEFNLDKLFDETDIKQNGGNQFSATSTFHNQNVNGIFSETSNFKGKTSSSNTQNNILFSPISSFKLSETSIMNGGQYSETSTNNINDNISEFSTTSL
jgi:hypothetical protein